MLPHQNAINDRAWHLWNSEARESFGSLMAYLNQHGVRNASGAPFQSPRGVASAITGTCNAIKRQGDSIEHIALVFTNQHDAYAWPDD
jgi:hypothetical protein